MNKPGTKTLMLVEDEPLIALSEKKKLEKYGYRVVTSQNGKDAVNTFKKHEDIDLVLMDINLGRGMDGTEAARKILAVRDVPVVFLSSHTEKEIVEKTEKITSYGYVVKNTGMTVLDASIKMAFRLFEAKREVQRREEELRKSEEKFRLIAESSIEDIWQLDLEGNVSYVSPAVESIFGYTTEEATGLGFSAFFPEFEIENAARVYESVVTKKESHMIEMTGQRKDGTLFPMEVSVTPIIKDDDIVGVQGIARDITERRQTEEALRENEEKYRTLYENMAQGAFYQRADGEIVDCNPAVLEMFGITRDQFLGKTSMDPGWKVIREDGTELPGEEHPSMEALKTGKPVAGFILGIYNPRKKIYVWLNVNAIPQFREGEKKPYQVFITLHDITGRKRAEKDLRESEERYRSTINGIVDYIHVIDNEMRLVLYNDAFKKQSGEMGIKGDLDGRTIFELFPFLTEEVRNDYQKILRTGKPVVSEEITEFDHKPTWTETRKIPVLDENGKVSRIITIIRDITERKLAERALIDRKNQLQKYLDIAGVMFVAINEKGFVTLVNRKGCEILGCNQEEIIGKNWFDTFIPEGKRKEIKSIFNRLMKGEIEPVEYVENVILGKNGSTRTVAWHNTILGDDEGNITGTLSSGEDVTDRRETEELYRTLVESSLQGIVILQDGSIIFANQPVAELSGYTVDELLNLSWEEIAGVIHPGHRDHVLEKLGEQVTGNESAQKLEFQFIRKDGGIRWVQTLSSRIEYRGKPAVHVAYIDITDHNKTEERYRFLAENMADIVWLLDRDLNTVYVSPSVEKVLGFTPEERMSQTLDQMMTPESFQRAVTLFQNEISRDKEEGADPERVVTIEVEYYRADGTTVWVENSMKALRGPAGELNGIYGSSRNISERKQFEESLRESERKYRLMFENMMDGFALHEIVLDGNSAPVDYVFLEVNPAFEKQTGLRGDEVLGRKVTEVIPDIEHDPAGWIGRYGRVALTGLPATFVEYSEPLGKWFSVQAYSLGAGRFVTVFENVTDRKMVQDNLKKERDLFSSGPVITIVWAPSKKWPVRYVSPNVKDALGYTPGEMTSRDFRYASLIHPDDFKRVSDEVKDFMTGGKDLFEQSYRLKHRDGQYRWYYDFTKLQRDETGKVTEIRGYLFDQTSLKNAEEELKSERERLRHIIDGTNVGTWEWNVQTGETVFNEKWAEIIGYTLEEISPLSIETWKKFAHPEDLQGSSGALERHFRGEAEFYEIEARMKHKNGNWVWVLDRGKVISWTNDGKPLWMFGTHQEVTQRKETEERIKSLLKEKELLLKEVHHRIKNNMGTISGLLSLQADILEEKSAARALVESANRINSMMLLYDRLYRNENIEDISISEYLTDLIEYILMTYPFSVTVNKKIEDLTIPVKTASPLGIIVNELISNAMKYAFREGRENILDVTVTLQDNRATVTVTDNGPGFDSNDQPEGFGLELVKLLANQINGTFTINNSEGTECGIEFDLQKE